MTALASGRSREPWLRSVEVVLDGVEDVDRHPFDVPAVRHLGRLDLHPRVTFLVGGNGSGKSTLVEAIALAAGFDAEGGSRNLTPTGPDRTSGLHRHLRLVRGPARPRTGFFLRAESFFNVATRVDELGPDVARAYGDRSLHAQSHGESFLSLVTNRFGPDGLYLLDEPEAALSPQGCLALLRAVHELVGAGGQFVIATHSPLLVAYPHADVHELDEHGLTRTPYDRTATFELVRSFTASPDRYLRNLLAD